MVTKEKQDIKNINVLIVEDDEGHIRLIEKNLRNSGLVGQISSVDSDNKAISLLTDESSKSLIKQGEPLLILLDLNIPEKGGYEVLRQISTNRAKIKTMVIVFSATSDPSEIKRCYQLGCNIFISKPLEYDRFAETIRSLGSFLRYIKFP